MAEQTISSADRATNWHIAAVLALLLGLLSLVADAWMINHPRTTSLPGLAALVVYAAVILTPMVIAIRAMRATRRTVHEQGGTALHVTSLVSDALYRSRGLLVVVIGTLPLLIYVTLYYVFMISAMFSNGMGCIGNYDYERFGCYLWPSPSNTDLLNSVLALMVLGIGFWGLALMGASLGVDLGLRSWYTTTLTIFVFALLLAVSIGWAWLLLKAPPIGQSVKAIPPLLASGPSATLVYMQGQTPIEDIPAITPGLLPQSIATTLFPFAVAAVIMYLSRRYLPKGTT